MRRCRIRRRNCTTGQLNICVVDTKSSIAVVSSESMLMGDR